MNRLLIIFMILCASVGFTQTSEKYNSDYENFYRAEDLFRKEQFGAARKEFRIFLDKFRETNDPMVIKARYYEGLSALEIYNNDAIALLEQFLKDYPESIYRNEVYYRVGKYFFQKKNYDDALAWFNKLSAKDLDPDQREEFYFKLGYSNFEEGNLTEARNAFHEVKDGNSQYSAPALYYYSHIAYTEGAYQTALEGFLKLKDDSRFSGVVPYYITQIYHKQGDFQKVIDYAPQIIDSMPPSNLSDMNHIVGDAYYQLGRYDEAVPYLEYFNSKSRTTREEDYQLGFAYYKSLDYDRAIRMFDKVTRAKDKLGQYAFYHIAECYVKLDQLLPARSAFQAASEIKDDPKIQEDALYNFAVLSYKLDLNPYDEAVMALELFLKKYPNSTRKNDVYQYLVNVYTTTNNHEKALSSLDNIPNKDARLKTAYQLVAFNYGVDLFQKGNYNKAIKNFELVSKYPIDPVLTGKARYWVADCHFRLDDMDKSIKNYRDFIALPATNLTEMKSDAYYNIGYAYLKKKEVSLSLDAFNVYVQSNVKNKQKLSDAYMRLGDGYYMLKQNDPAIKNYQEVLKLKKGYEDQALFYMAKAYGYADKADQKIKLLLDLINNYTGSKFMLTATYELAMTYKSKADYDKAYKYFNQVLDDYPNAVIVVDCKIEIADIYFKRGEYGKSEAEYTRILETYGADRNVCEQCARGLIDIYKALKQPEKATALASRYPCANFSNDEEEDLFYSPAIDAYVDSLYSAAVPNFEKYLSRFPNGKYAVEGEIFLANCYYAMDNKEKAIITYQKALERPNNNYTEFAASRVAQHLYNKGEYDKALVYYDRMEKVGTKPSVIFNAKLGLMRCHFLVENWTSAVIYAKEVLESSQLNNTLRLEAHYALGMSSYNIESYNDAKKSLEWITKNTTTVMAAEAKYTLAEMYYKLQDYTKSDAEIRELLKMKPAHNYWIAKSLILQSRILIIKDDLFQAEQTLKSVLDHYPDQNDGIINEAQELYNELMQLKNKPKSLETQEGMEIEVNQENGGN